jgi:predicted AAA+ superfamily ATPase
MFIENVAFLLKDNSLKAILNPSPITVDMLKNYEQEKKIVENNIINFLNDLPYSDMLLYGDRGTGKSSTIHAMLNKYKGQGLRLIEVSKEQILQLGYIKELVCDQPLKFIIFIDDLSLDEYDEKTSSLKASIEGSISGGSKNTMLVATSNRRHIVKETFMDRENSVHASDSLEEQLSLSDRFGITVMFSSTDKSQYLSIVKQLAKDVNLKMDEGELFAIAERWAVSKGGRSPRRSKQIVDLIYSALSRGEEIDF